jgi:hypothetical protein
VTAAQVPGFLGELFRRTYGIQMALCSGVLVVCVWMAGTLGIPAEGRETSWVYHAALAGFAGWAAYVLVVAIRSFADPWWSPTLRPLAAHAGAGDVLREIAEQLDAPDCKAPMRGSWITRDWLVLRPRPMLLHVVRLADIVWVYPHVVTSTVRVKRLPVGETESRFLDIVLRDGREVRAASQSGGVGILYSHLIRKAPWAFRGWSPETAALHEEDFDALVAVVDERIRTGKYDLLEAPRSPSRKLRQSYED